MPPAAVLPLTAWQRPWRPARQVTRANHSVLWSPVTGGGNPLTRAAVCDDAAKRPQRPHGAVSAVKRPFDRALRRAIGPGPATGLNSHLTECNIPANRLPGHMTDGPVPATAVTVALLLQSCYRGLVTAVLLPWPCYCSLVTVALLLQSCYCGLVTAVLLPWPCYCSLVTVALLLVTAVLLLWPCNKAIALLLPNFRRPSL